MDRDGSDWLGGRDAGRCGPRRSGGQRDGFGFASQGTWICPTRSRHSAGIGAPDSSRRYQAWTWATFTSRPEIVTMRGFRTFAGPTARRGSRRCPRRGGTRGPDRGRENGPPNGGAGRRPRARGGGRPGATRPGDGLGGRRRDEPPAGGALRKADGELFFPGAPT